MFKSKWQKKYERAVKNIEFWKEYHHKQMNLLYGKDQFLYEQHLCQAVTLNDVLTDMKHIAERG